MKIEGSGSGVYLLKLKSEVVYVGRSRNVLARFNGHRGKLYDEVEIVWCLPDQLSETEKKFIHQYHPRLNRVYYEAISRLPKAKRIKQNTPEAIAEYRKRCSSQIRISRAGMVMIASTIYLPEEVDRRVRELAVERTLLEGRYISKSKVLVDIIENNL